MKRISWVTRLLLIASLAACGGEEGEGRRIAFTLATHSVPVGDAPLGEFTTRTGWALRLEEARVAVGPLQLYAKPPPTARRLLPLDLLVRRAWAHAGFDRYDGGEVRGELLEQRVVDALAPGPQPLARLPGIAGPVRSATLELQPPGPGAEGLHGFHAWVKGTATRGEEALRFEGGLTLPEGDFSRKVVGIPVELELDEGSEVVLELHLERWFDEADFSTLAPAAEGQARVIHTDTQVARAWRLGLRSFGSFSIR